MHCSANVNITGFLPPIIDYLSKIYHKCFELMAYTHTVLVKNPQHKMKTKQIHEEKKKTKTILKDNPA